MYFGTHISCLFSPERIAGIWSLYVQSLSSAEAQSMLKICRSVMMRCIRLCVLLIPPKQGSQWLSEPLVFLFNLSLKTRKLPSDWTSANITNVHKRGSKHDPENYQPISLTSIVTKIMECLVHRKIKNFLNEYNKLHLFQHGFRRGHLSKILDMTSKGELYYSCLNPFSGFQQNCFCQQ